MCDTGKSDRYITVCLTTFFCCIVICIFLYQHLSVQAYIKEGYSQSVTSEGYVIWTKDKKND